ncbi:MAG: hypothetical protein RIQ34_781 [Bacteroidota bacterium]
MKRILSVFTFLSLSFWATAQTIVISQAYGGGGNASATYNQDFVELFNASGSTVDISGWSIQYGSATGTGNWSVGAIPASTTIASGKYYLIALATGANGVALPVAADLTNTAINLSGTAGKVALVNNATPLVGAAGCSTAGVIDVLGYGTTANCSEASPFPATSITTAQAIFRKNNGCTDANNNSTDFELLNVAPRNSATAANVCGGGASPALALGTVSPFGSVTSGSNSTGQTISLSGSNLTGAPGNITITAPNTDFQVSSDNTTWGATATIPYTSATLAATSFYVRFTPQSNGVKSANVSLAGGGASATLAVSGTGVSISAPVATAATAVGGTGFTANWNAVIGATGYFLDVYTKVPGQVTETLAGWNCATATLASQTADVFNANNINNNSLNIQGITPIPTLSYPSGPSGASGSPNPYSVSTNTWDNGQDTKYWQVDVNTTGASNITVSSLQGSSNTGPKDFKLQYKVGAAGAWTDVTGGTVALTTTVLAGTLNTWGALTDVALPAAANNQALISLRWIMTSNTGINASPVASTGTSRISAIYIKGQVNGFVNAYAQQNISVGNVTSYAVTGLTTNTTYYYVVRTNGVSTSVNSNEISVVTTAATPTLSSTTLTGYGNVCVNTAVSSNSFTITGSNLTSANVVVGPLSGFAFGTSASGPFQSTLSLTQSGGAYSQAVFVQFSPTAVQSYNGNIPVSGGGATAITVAASGTGINTLATVVGGTASSITQTSATVAGTISSNGCSALTAYGIEYSTTSGFANGAGTAVASSNLSAGSFSAALTGLTQGTTYYYHAYATNGGGTAYSTELSFTTATPNPIITASSLTAFGNVCINTSAGPNSFTLTGSNLTNADVVLAALAGYSFSTTSGGTYTTTLSITQPGGVFSQAVFVKFQPTAVQSYTGNISISGGGIAAAINVAASGSGVNTASSVTTDAASAITATSATCAGTITSIGCSAITAYGIEYSTTNGFSNGSGTSVAASNLSGGNFSSNLSGLSSGTTYYYKAYATNGGGTTWGTQQSFTTVAPSLSAGTLTAFGNVCINNATTPNAFTITGTNLTTANVVVGALTGYTFSTTSTGAYTTTLSITQPGGAFSQVVYVKFTPTAVQSYNGNIPVSGGGSASAINVAATGAGISTAPTVVTGVASSITTTGATVASSISATGCTSVTAYGIEYSTLSGFANGSGTQVSSSNLNAGAFSSALSGLTPATTYYYKAYATNAGGTSYGTQSSFTTTAPPPPQLTVSTLTGFGSVCVNALVGPNTFTITGSNLTATLITVGPLAGYSFSQTTTGSYNNTIDIINPGGTQSYMIYVKFNPLAAQSYNGAIPVAGGGAPTVYVNASGTGANTPPTAVTGAASSITTRSAVLAGSIAASGCSSVTAYGIEYSSINGFANGTGTKLPSTNLSGSAFQSSVGGLLQGATYYYKAYATSSAGTAYGAQQSFTLTSIGAGFRIFPSPARPGESVNLTVLLTDLNPGYYGLQFFDVSGRMIHVHNMSVQGNFIDRSIPLPAHWPIGIYEVRLINFEKELGRQRIVIH